MDADSRDEMDARDQNITFGQLSTLAFNMLSTGVPQEEVKDFVEKTCESESLPAEYRAMLIASFMNTAMQQNTEQDGNVQSPSSGSAHPATSRTT